MEGDNIMLLEQIKSDIKHAMLTRDEARRDILRVVIGEVQRKVGAESDDDVKRTIRKIIEGNTETLSNLGNDVRTSKLVKENEILNEYLPKMWSVEQIEAFFLNSNEPYFEQIIEAKGEGTAMGLAMRTLKSVNAPVDGKDVKLVIQKIRSQSN